MTKGFTANETYIGSDDLASYEFYLYETNAGAAKRRRRIE